MKANGLLTKVARARTLAIEITDLLEHTLPSSPEHTLVLIARSFAEEAAYLLDHAKLPVLPRVRQLGGVQPRVGRISGQTIKSPVVAGRGSNRWHIAAGYGVVVVSRFTVAASTAINAFRLARAYAKRRHNRRVIIIEILKVTEPSKTPTHERLNAES